MSRIGKMPVAIPKGVEVKSDSGQVRVKGPKGELASSHPRGPDGHRRRRQVRSPAARDEPQQRAVHGLLRSLVANSSRA